CAAEKRRRRKRGRLADPDIRVFINEAVCEGCGDCSVQSNCMSILPKPTALGLKRQIDQSACNKDLTCLKGFCPAFVTLRGGRPRKPDAASIAPERLDNLPPPARQPRGNQTVMVAGIGGTGVVTVGALLAMAAHLEGRSASVFDVTGLAQKNGAVYSHIRIGDPGDELGPQRLGGGEADLMLAFDMMAAADPQALKTLGAGRSTLIGNSAIAPGAAFQFAASETGLPDDALIRDRLIARVGPDNSHLIDGTRLARAACGDTIAINLLVVGYAYQLGQLALSPEAIERAIALNGVAVDFNIRAFRIGRLVAADPGLVAELTEDKTQAQGVALDLDDHAKLVADYQDNAWGQRFLSAIGKLAAAGPEAAALADTAAPILSRLMRYKDEYEVARLLTAPTFEARLAAAFEGAPRVEFNLAPPLLTRPDARTGRPAKRAFGPWLRAPLRGLARLRRLRGTWADPFGRTEERRMERGLIDWYEGLIDRCAREITAETADAWAAILSAPDAIRGFGPVKAANAARVRAEVEAKLAGLVAGPSPS
ncbi:MAG: 2-oxoacid:acceptor oxidoreductase family protein, partial [Maritimibacter sp.]|nr:2-oxoacid:acceptor oxidoreductase family protein [Maritimibacter sp.]